MKMYDKQPELTVLNAEVHEVLLGAVKAAAQDQLGASRIEKMKGVSGQDWMTAARALLMAHRTSVLEALSLPSLEAVAYGLIDLRDVLHRGTHVADEHSAESAIRAIASRRLNMDLDEKSSALHSLEMGLLHDALLESYLSGQNSRSA